MSQLLTRRPGGANRKAALRAASTPPSPLSRCAASSLTTPPHLRFVEVVREQGRRHAREAYVMDGRQSKVVVNGGRRKAEGRWRQGIESVGKAAVRRDRREVALGLRAGAGEQKKGKR